MDMAAAQDNYLLCPDSQFPAFLTNVSSVPSSCFNFPTQHNTTVPDPLGRERALPRDRRRVPQRARAEPPGPPPLAPGEDALLWGGRCVPAMDE